MKQALTCLTSLLLTSLAALHAADVPATEPVTIVAFGASTTAVRGSTKVYASILQEELRASEARGPAGPGDADGSWTGFSREDGARSPEVLGIP